MAGTKSESSKSLHVRIAESVFEYKGDYLDYHPHSFQSKLNAGERTEVGREIYQAKFKEAASDLMNAYLRLPGSRRQSAR